MYIFLKKIWSNYLYGFVVDQCILDRTTHIYIYIYSTKNNIVHLYRKPTYCIYRLVAGPTATTMTINPSCVAINHYLANTFDSK